MASRRYWQGSLARVAVLCCSLACGKRLTQDPTPAPAASAHTTVGGPRLRLEPDGLDLGAIGFEEPSKGRIQVANVGQAPLVVERIESSRFCLGNLGMSTIPSSARVPLDVVCRSDLVGPMREQLTLHTNDLENRSAKLEIVGNVTPIVAFSSPQILQTMPFGESQSEEVHLIGSLAKDARISLVSAADPAIFVTLLPAQANKAAGLHLRCKGDQVGEHVGQIVVATGLQNPAQVSLSWGCKVQGTLEVNPTNPYFNLKISGPQSLFIDVRSRQPGFQLRSVRVKEGPYRAAIVAGQPPGQARVKVEFADDLFKDESRGVNGTLVIYTNDRTEPAKDIPLLGFGMRNRVQAPEP